MKRFSWFSWSQSVSAIYGLGTQAEDTDRHCLKQPKRFTVVLAFYCGWNKTILFLFYFSCADSFIFILFTTLTATVKQLHQWSDVETRQRLRSASSSSLVVRRTVFTSAIELFRSPLPDSGTLCCRTSCWCRHRLFVRNARRSISSVVLSQIPCSCRTVSWSYRTP